MVDHEFGGLSTDLKLSIVEKYLHAYTTALRGKFDNLWSLERLPKPTQTLKLSELTIRRRMLLTRGRWRRPQVRETPCSRLAT